ncbi:oligosaccharide repeat unit polymerase [Polynucleobacter wuianus]|uniref:O-antigen polymerase n=1 Tax=Polynucleobacter wuianus TaxID=1743168 RepID=UPI001C0B1CC4|nr:O-antigen polymerase [Polynucleobacter wuianus]MBU3611171.1 oligosaccharide repeat unit polymerase [Polynucleobacter wuianus]
MNIYRLVIFEILTIPLWLIAGQINSFSLAVIAALVATILIFIILRSELNINKKLYINYLALASIFLILIINIGWLISYYIIQFKLNDIFSVYLIENLNIKIVNYSYAVAYTTFFAIAVGLFSSTDIVKRYINLIYQKLLKIVYFDIDLISKCIFIISLVEIVLIASGFIIYRGIATEDFDEGRIPWYLFALNSIFNLQSPLMAVLTIKILGNYRKINPTYKILLIFSMTISIVVFFTRGRAPLGIFLLSYIVFVNLLNSKNLNLKSFYKAILLLIPVFFVLATLFNFVRLGESGSKDLKNENIITVMKNGLEIYFSDQNIQSIANEAVAINLASRPLVLIATTKALEVPFSQSTFLYGKALYNHFIWTIPSIFYSFRDKLLVQRNEVVINLFHPLFDVDISDNPIIYSYIDFGYFGLFLYPLILFLFIVNIQYLMSLYFVHPLIILMILSNLFPLFILGLGESDLNTWMSAYRDNFLIIMISFLLNFISKIKWNN